MAGTYIEKRPSPTYVLGRPHDTRVSSAEASPYPSEFGRPHHTGVSSAGFTIPECSAGLTGVSSAGLTIPKCSARLTIPGPHHTVVFGRVTEVLGSGISKKSRRSYPSVGHRYQVRTATFTFPQCSVWYSGHTEPNPRLRQGIYRAHTLGILRHVPYRAYPRKFHSAQHT